MTTDWRSKVREAYRISIAAPGRNLMFEDMLLPTIERVLHDATEKATHCQKDIEGGVAICGVKLDCHLHDWRAKV